MNKNPIRNNFEIGQKLIVKNTPWKRGTVISISRANSMHDFFGMFTVEFDNGEIQIFRNSERYDFAKFSSNALTIFNEPFENQIHNDTFGLILTNEETLLSEDYSLLQKFYIRSEYLPLAKAIVSEEFTMVTQFWKIQHCYLDKGKKITFAKMPDGYEYATIHYKRHWQDFKMSKHKDFV